VDIAVIGGGNGSHAAAADLAEQGHQVRMWRRDAEAFQAVLKRNAIKLSDAKGTRTVPLASATTDLADALRGTDLIVAPVPATAQKDLAEQLAPHLQDGQVVYMPPGSFGTYVMAKALAAARPGAEVAFAEAGTLPYLARMQDKGHVAIRVRATRLPTGVFPAHASDHAFTILRGAYPAVEPLRDALDGALMNAGPIIHPPLILMNAGPLEHFLGAEHGWDIHKEGTQPAIRRVTDALDAERIAVRESLGYGAPHFPLADHYDDAREEWMYGNSSHERLTDSGDWRESIDLNRHRYMREDIEIGLALLVSLGRYASVATPVASGLLALGGAVCETDFIATGRTLENLGLAGQSRSELAKLLDDGIPA